MNIVASIPLWIAAAFTLIFGLGCIHIIVRDGHKPEISGGYIAAGILLSLVFLAASSGFAVLAVKVAS